LSKLWNPLSFLFLSTISFDNSAPLGWLFQGPTAPAFFMWEDACGLPVVFSQRYQTWCPLGSRGHEHPLCHRTQFLGSVFIQTLLPIPPRAGLKNVLSCNCAFVRGSDLPRFCIPTPKPNPTTLITRFFLPQRSPRHETTGFFQPPPLIFGHPKSPSPPQPLHKNTALFFVPFF